MKRLFGVLVTALLSGSAFATGVGSHWFNDSVVITTGGTFQSLTFSAKPPKTLWISDTNASDACWVDVSGSASPTTAASIKLTSTVPVLLLTGSLVPTDTVQVTCTTTSDTLAVFDQ